MVEVRNRTHLQERGRREAVGDQLDGFRNGYCSIQGRLANLRIHSKGDLDTPSMDGEAQSSYGKSQDSPDGLRSTCNGAGRQPRDPSIEGEACELSGSRARTIEGT